MVKQITVIEIWKMVLDPVRITVLEDGIQETDIEQCNGSLGYGNVKTFGAL